MKFSDLYENKKSEFSDELTREVMDMIVLYRAAGVNKTNINNIIDEMSKLNYSVDMETMTDIVKQLGFDVKEDTIIFSEEEDDLELSDGDEYDEVSSMAKSATDKRMK